MPTPRFRRPAGRIPDPSQGGSDKKLREYMRITGKAVLLLRRAVDEWHEDQRNLKNVPAIYKDKWLHDFIVEAREIIGDPELIVTPDLP